MTTPTILRGSVLTSADPLGLGRVKVQVPQATGTAALWADPLQPAAAPAPAAGSAVWVLFESGDPALPVYVPSTAFTDWTDVPSSWLAAPWTPGSAAYRLGPGGEIQFQGELVTPDETSSTALANGFTLMTLPAAFWPVQNPASCPVAILPGGGSASVPAVARVFSGTVTILGSSGGWSFTGYCYVSLFGLRYAAGN